MTRKQLRNQITHLILNASREIYQRSYEPEIICGILTETVEVIDKKYKKFYRKCLT